MLQLFHSVLRSSLLQLYLPLTFLPSFYLRLSMSFAFSLEFFFALETKAACRIRLYFRRVVSFRLFRSRRFGFALRAFNLFTSSPLYAYEYVCVCARFALSLSAIDSLQTHTCVCAYAHTHT